MNSIYLKYKIKIGSCLESGISIFLVSFLLASIVMMAPCMWHPSLKLHNCARFIFSHAFVFIFFYCMIATLMGFVIASVLSVRRRATLKTWIVSGICTAVIFAAIKTIKDPPWSLGVWLQFVVLGIAGGSCYCALRCWFAWRKNHNNRLD